MVYLLSTASHKTLSHLYQEYCNKEICFENWFFFSFQLDTSEERLFKQYGGPASRRIRTVTGLVVGWFTIKAISGEHLVDKHTASTNGFCALVALIRCPHFRQSSDLAVDMTTVYYVNYMSCLSSYWSFNHPENWTIIKCLAFQMYELISMSMWNVHVLIFAL